MVYDVCDVWYVWNERISIYLHTLQQKTFICRERAKVWCSLFPFRKRSLLFLTVAATIGNQVFSHDKLWNGLGSPVIDVSVKKDSLLVYALNFFGILAGRCGSVLVREIMIRKVRVQQWIAAFVLFNRNTLNNRSIFFFIVKMAATVTERKFASRCFEQGLTQG